jgi:TIR domain-containing protein
MDVQTIWLLILAAATPIALVVGFAIRSQRAARQEQERLAREAAERERLRREVEAKKLTIFVSYSSMDRYLVSPVVALLRLNESTLVFHDVDSLRLGKHWRTQVEDALTKAHLLILFWCVHSSKSDEVQAEYQLAIQSQKDVLPVLLDDTPLPDALAAYQWIDFRIAGHQAQMHSPDYATFVRGLLEPLATAIKRQILLRHFDTKEKG